MVYFELGIVTVLIVINGLLANVRTGHRFVATGATGGAGREKRQRFPPRACPRIRSRQISFDGPDRNHPHRRPVRRVFRRHARFAADGPVDRCRMVARRGRCHRRRHRRHCHHLRIPHHGRTGAQADCAARSGIGGRARGARPDAACEDLGTCRGGFSTDRARHCCGCWVTVVQPKRKSARRKSAPWSSRPKTLAFSEPGEKEDDCRRHASRRPSRRRGHDPSA